MQKSSLFASSNLMIATTLFGGMLYELYPNHEALLHIGQSGYDLKTQFANPLQAEYARVKIQEDVLPSKILALAEQLTTQHFWRESSYLLGRLSNHADPNIRQQVDWLLLKNRLDAYYSTTTNKAISEPMRHAAKQTVRTQLVALAKYPDWDTKKLMALAQYCSDFNLLPQAARRFAQLAEIDTKKKQQWLITAASSAELAGLWPDAERYLRKVRDDKATVFSKSSTACAWMEAAIKTGQRSEVIGYLSTIQKKLPNDPIALEQLASFSLKVGEPTIAVSIYQKLASIDLRNAQTWHEKAAHWAQAAGLYQESADALDYAQALAQNPAELLSLQHRSIGLWIKARQPDKALAALKPLLAHPEYKEQVLEQSVRVAYLAEQQQQNKLAVGLWQWILPRSDEPSLWKHVALWQSGHKRYAASLATWEQIEKRFGTDTQITLMKIQLHWELRQYKQATQLAQNHSKKLGKTASTYQRTILAKLPRKSKEI